MRKRGVFRANLPHSRPCGLARKLDLGLSYLDLIRRQEVSFGRPAAPPVLPPVLAILPNKVSFSEDDPRRCQQSAALQIH